MFIGWCFIISTIAKIICFSSSQDNMIASMYSPSASKIPLHYLNFQGGTGTEKVLKVEWVFCIARPTFHNLNLNTSPINHNWLNSESRQRVQAHNSSVSVMQMRTLHISNKPYDGMTECMAGARLRMPSTDEENLFYGNQDCGSAMASDILMVMR